MTLADRCVALLTEGPATTGELSAELGTSTNELHVALTRIKKRGRVLSRYIQQEHTPGNWNAAVLWMIPEHAPAWL